MMPRIRSFAVTPSASSPRTRTCIDLGRALGMHWVASTCSTCEVPIPIASAPKAPWVDVWLSPQTIVMPGCVSPISGPMTCTIPWCGLWMSKNSIPNSRAFLLSASICRRARSSTIGSERSTVGMAWSTVATQSSGRRTLRPASRSPSNAWGEVTSWRRWRST